jgi:hypothetical protein
LIAKTSPANTMSTVMEWDNNYFGLILIPIGLVLGFGPALFVAAFGSKDEPDVSQRGKPRG